MTDVGVSTPDAGPLLERITAFIGRFVVLPDGVAPLLAAWVLHTWTLDAAYHTPYVVIRSATKGCGKSTLLDVLKRLVRRPVSSASMTPAAMYRSIGEGEEPTMLLDEQDGLRDSRGLNEDMRKILNAGFRRGEKVHRVDEREVKEFPAFCPKALAAIGRLPDTVADRAIDVKMERKLSSEPVQPFRDLEADALAEPIRRDIAIWAESAGPGLKGRRPACPIELDGRGQDIYTPLFAIAESAGAEWPAKVRDAAVANRRAHEDERDDSRSELLRDIRTVLGRHRPAFIGTRDLLDELLLDPLRRWRTWRGGSPLTEKGLASMLREFGVRPIVKQTDGHQRRGYDVSRLEELFERYLEPADPGDALPPEVRNPFLLPRKKPQEQAS
jgi:hypothetical protein